MAVWWHQICYVIIYVAATITNKYVLSVLNFTYPTLFQGWQTLVGFVITRIAASLNQIHLSPLDRTSLRNWLPASLLYIIVIYSGSKALSRIPVAAFVVQHNTIEILVFLGEWLYTGRLPSYLNQSGLLLIIASAVGVWISDPQLSPIGYTWMLIHVISSSIYTLQTIIRQPLKEVDQVHFNYLTSVLILIPASFVEGDISAMEEYPHWTLYRFQTGCIMSGILGATLMMIHLALKQQSGTISTNMALTVAKAFLVVTSVFVFDGVIYTAQFTFSIVAGLVGHWLVCYTKPQFDPDSAHVPPEDKEVKELQ
ncbi:UDP-N-acetylglucosamine transporter TMEM241-like [Amphiura filiformis]|uniref:UDP-N-acetylglucosamine transporter TMEM241-like n=1 Tax=Amphiura filiformis TaxID=82378 RepID=UPI003B21D432